MLQINAVLNSEGVFEPTIEFIDGATSKKMSKKQLAAITAFLINGEFASLFLELLQSKMSSENFAELQDVLDKIVPVVDSAAPNEQSVQQLLDECSQSLITEGQ